MPYLDPDAVLRRFSTYALEEIRPALRDDEEFMRGQVGSMASTLRFLATELDGIDDAIAAQRCRLLEALDEAQAIVDDPDVREDLSTAAEHVTEAGDSPREIERSLLTAADDALAAVDTLPEPTAREARRPLYGFLDARVEAQLRLLGRPGDG